MADQERKRLEYLRQTYLPRLDAETGIKGLWNMNAGTPFAETVFKTLHKVDPSEKRIYLQRLLNWALKGEIGQEHLDDMHRMLLFFENNKQRMPASQRDFNGFRLRSDFEQAVCGDLPERLHAIISRHKDEWIRLGDDFPAEATMEQHVRSAMKILVDQIPGRGAYAADIIRWMESEKERLLPEDLDRVKGYLLVFRKNRDRISPTQKDIGAYRTWTHLQDVVEPFSGKIKLSIPEIEANEARAIASQNATLIGKGSDWRLIRIDTENGAIVLGKGTDWCTAKTEGTNYFKDYNDDLLYLRIDGGDRYQLYLRTMHFRDSKDRQCAKLANMICDRPELTGLIANYIKDPVEFIDNIREDNWADFDFLSAFVRRSEANLLNIAGHAPELLLKATDPGNPKPLRIVYFMQNALETCPPWKTAMDKVADQAIPFALKQLTAPNYSLSYLERFLMVCGRDARWSQVVAEEITYVYDEARTNHAARAIIEDSCINNRDKGWSIDKPGRDAYHLFYR